MKVTIQKIRETKPALDIIAATKLPAVASMRVAAVVRALQPALMDFDREFNNLLAECGEPMPGEPGAPVGTPQQFKIRDEKVEHFNAESIAMHSHEVEIPGDPIPAQMFGNAEITPSVLAALDWLVVV